MTQEADKFTKAIQTIEEMCPTEWAIIGRELIGMSIARVGQPIEQLPFLYVEKSTIVSIIEKLGYKI